jgi:hypothetical protein
MNETLIVKNLLVGLCKNQSDLTLIEQDAVRQFLAGKLSQNTLQTILTSK